MLKCKLIWGMRKKHCAPRKIQIKDHANQINTLTHTSVFYSRPPSTWRIFGRRLDYPASSLPQPQIIITSNCMPDWCDALNHVSTSLWCQNATHRPMYSYANLNADIAQMVKVNIPPKIETSCFTRSKYCRRCSICIF